MKKLLITVAVLGAVALLFFAWFRTKAPVQPRAVASIPVAVAEALRRAYPNARVVHWTRENGQFEAEFNDGVTEKKTWLMLTSAGDITEREVEIEQGQLPVPIGTHIRTCYKGYDVTQATVIQPNSGSIIYEAELTQGTRQRDVYMQADGTEVKIPKPRKRPAQGHSHNWSGEPISQYHFF